MDSAEQTGKGSIANIISGLYHHFIIYDLTYTLSGLLIVGSVGYVYCGGWTAFHQSFLGSATSGLYKFLMLIGATYVVGILAFDLWANVTYAVIERLWRSCHTGFEGCEAIKYEVLIDRVKSKLGRATEDIDLSLARHDHFEVVTLAFSSSFVASSLVLWFVPLWSNRAIPSPWLPKLFLILAGLTFVSFLFDYFDGAKKKKQLLAYLETCNGKPSSNTPNTQ